MSRRIIAIVVGGVLLAMVITFLVTRSFLAPVPVTIIEPATPAAIAAAPAKPVAAVATAPAPVAPTSVLTVAPPAPSAPAVPVTTTAPAPATAPTQVTANPTQPATTKGPKIGDMNPNVDAVNVGTCKGVSNDDGLYIQSGEVGRCTSKLSELPAGSQLVVDGIQFSVNGVEYLNTIKAFDLGNATTLDIAITNGGAKLGPKDVAIKRFCTISRTATVNNWALPNREPVPAWGLKLDATKNCA